MAILDLSFYSIPLGPLIAKAAFAFASFSICAIFS
jgi:hypothetical protein